jgi:hypothetical protein
MINNILLINGTLHKYGLVIKITSCTKLIYTIVVSEAQYI